MSDFDGRAEVDQSCGAASYGTAFCTYPWYVLNKTLGGFPFGGDYPGATNDYEQAAEFQQTTSCPRSSGPDTTYCATVLK